MRIASNLSMRPFHSKIAIPVREGAQCFHFFPQNCNFRKYERDVAINLHARL